MRAAINQRGLAMNLSNKRFTALRCISMVCLVTLISASSSAQFFGGGRGRWGGERNTPMMERFDHDKNGYLDKTERKAALEALGEDAEVYSGEASNKVKGSKLTPAQVKSYPGKSLYDPTVLRTLFLTFEDANWEAELMAFHGTDIDIPVNA